MERRNFLAGCVAGAAGFATARAEQTKHELSFSQYVIVELMGYKRLAGRLCTGPIAGLLQLDIPVEGGFVTQLVNPQAIYRLTLTNEATVKEMSKTMSDPLPALSLEIDPRDYIAPIYRD